MPILIFVIASWADQCTVAVDDYALGLSYVEDAEPSDASCSEYRVYYPYNPSKRVCEGRDYSNPSYQR